MPKLSIADLSAQYASTRVLDKVSLEIDDGEVTSLIGPSGSGKSTLLRVIVGLLKPLFGSIAFDGQVVDYTDAAAVRAMRDQCAIVFQGYNLFQNMTALQNITIGPIKIRRRAVAEVHEEAMGLLERVGLADKAASYPSQLSGGQQQRVAIARALALRPRLLLLDEVTSALDPELVNDVLDTIRMLVKDHRMTMLVVSHEMGFVRDISSRIVFMAEGKIVEVGTPAQIFASPAQPRTQDFVAKIRSL
ncbi:MAG: amino acid ABC transporter ATP-binding protein [Variovorax sp.]